MTTASSLVDSARKAIGNPIRRSAVDRGGRYAVSQAQRSPRGTRTSPSARPAASDHTRNANILVPGTQQYYILHLMTLVDFPKSKQTHPKEPAMAKSGGKGSAGGQQSGGSKGGGARPNPNYPSTTGKPSGGGRGNTPKSK
jgi:hypothetical protein